MAFTSFATRGSRTSFLLSLALASGPLVLGVAIFLLWLPTRWPVLEVAGLLNIYAGVLAVCAAGLLFLLHSFLELRSPAGSGEGLIARLVAILVIAFLNFPTCVWILSAVETVQDEERRADMAFWVRVANRSEHPLEAARVTGVLTLELGSVEPAAEIVQDIEPAGTKSGALSLEGTWRGESKSWPMSSDFEARRGYGALIVLGPDGSVSLTEEDLAAYSD